MTHNAARPNEHANGSSNGHASNGHGSDRQDRSRKEKKLADNAPQNASESAPVSEPPKSIDNPKRLFVGGLPPDMNDQELFQEFQKHGEIEDAKVMHDRHTLRSRGFGFVTFKDYKVARDLLKVGNHADGVGRLRLKGKMVEIKEAKPKAHLERSGHRYQYQKRTSNHQRQPIMQPQQHQQFAPVPPTNHPQHYPVGLFPVHYPIYSTTMPFPPTATPFPREYAAPFQQIPAHPPSVGPNVPAAMPIVPHMPPNFIPQPIPMYDPIPPHPYNGIPPESSISPYAQQITQEHQVLQGSGQDEPVNE